MQPHTNGTVVGFPDQIGTIESEFRTFPMEVLAGDDDMEVTLRH